MAAKSQIMVIHEDRVLLVAIRNMLVANKDNPGMHFDSSRIAGRMTEELWTAMKPFDPKPPPYWPNDRGMISERTRNRLFKWLIRMEDAGALTTDRRGWYWFPEDYPEGR